MTGLLLGSFSTVGVSDIFFNDTLSFSVKTSSAKLIVFSPFGTLFFLIALGRVLEVLEVTGFEVTGLYNGLSFILTLTAGTINSFSSTSAAALAFLSVVVASFDVYGRFLRETDEYSLAMGLADFALRFKGGEYPSKLTLKYIWVKVFKNEPSKKILYEITCLVFHRLQEIEILRKLFRKHFK